MTEEDWDLSKRSQAITRIANYWVKKGETEEDVSGWPPPIRANWGSMWLRLPITEVSMLTLYKR